MSRFSGKNDLYDCLMRFGNAPDNTIKSELEAVEKLKKQTGGVIYRSFQVEVFEENMDFVRDYNPFFSYDVINEVVIDKRCKSGMRTKTHYKFYYFDREYDSLEALNEHEKISIRLGIRFDNIFDLMPFYPCELGIVSRDAVNDTAYLELGVEEYPEVMRSVLRSAGRALLNKEATIAPFSQTEIAKHFKEVYDYLRNKGV